MLSILVAGGVPPITADLVAKYLDAGMAVASVITMFSGFGLTLALVRSALKAGGKKAIAA